MTPIQSRRPWREVSSTLCTSNRPFFSIAAHHRPIPSPDPSYPSPHPLRVPSSPSPMSTPLLFTLLLLLLFLFLLAFPDPATAGSPSLRRVLLSKSKPKSWKWVLGFAVGAVVGIVAGGLCSALFRLLLGIVRGRFRDPKGPVIFSPWIKRATDLAFLEADEGIEGLELIGSGGCGKVYKAELRSSPGRTIAIKRIARVMGDWTAEIGDEEESRMLDKRMRQLRSEIMTVGHIRHRNLVPLLAHVPHHDCHYLVYEYMKNGSLQDAISAVAAGQRELPWSTRFRIAQGVAAGLEYLHLQHKPKIIHRDLKPGNILLDDNLDARIADFGLAKSVPDANTHMTTSNVAGTIGYIAPEYHQMLRFTDKCDVYSFGVILAVLVVGKMPSDAFFQDTDEMSMVKWMKNMVAAGDETVLEAAVDKRMMGEGQERQTVLVMKVACFCTVEDPKERPNSKEVRCMLDQIAKENN